jgi:hypothetical protein
MTSICLVREPAEAFDLKPDGNDTTLLFAHRSFKNADDEYASATTRWGYYLLSLKRYLETGKGTPNPDILTSNRCERIASCDAGSESFQFSTGPETRVERSSCMATGQRRLANSKPRLNLSFDPSPIDLPPIVQQLF